MSFPINAAFFRKIGTGGLRFPLPSDNDMVDSEAIVIRHKEGLLSNEILRGSFNEKGVFLRPPCFESVDIC